MAAKDFLLNVVYYCHEYCGYNCIQINGVKKMFCFRMMVLGTVENSQVVLMRDPRLVHLKLTHQSH